MEEGERRTGMLRASVPRPWRVRGGDSPSACVPPALCTTPASAQVGAVSANLIVAICPRLQSQPSYLCRRHFAPLSGGKARVRFLYFACARAAQVGGMCRLGGGGAGGAEVRAPRGAWRTWGPVRAQHVADGGGAGTCRGARGTARPQAAGGAMEARGGQRGTSVHIAVVCN